MSYRGGRGPRHNQYNNWNNNRRFRNYRFDYDYLPYYPYYLDYLDYDDIYGYPYVLQVEGMTGQSTGSSIASGVISLIILILVIVGVYYAVKWFRKPSTPGQEALEHFKKGAELAKQAIQEKIDIANKSLQAQADKMAQAIKK